MSVSVLVYECSMEVIECRIDITYSVYTLTHSQMSADCHIFLLFFVLHTWVRIKIVENVKYKKRKEKKTALNLETNNMYEMYTHQSRVESIRVE